MDLYAPLDRATLGVDGLDRLERGVVGDAGERATSRKWPAAAQARVPAASKPCGGSGVHAAVVAHEHGIAVAQDHGLDRGEQLRCWDSERLRPDCLR